MQMKSIVILFAWVVVAVIQLISAQNLELDVDLLSTITAVEGEFDSYIKRGFTNFGFKQYQLHMNNVVNGKQFGDISIKEGNNHITIRNMKIVNKITPRISNSLSHLMESNLQIDFELHDISLEGNFESYNTEFLDFIPLIHQGKIEIRIENVKASGYVGLAMYGDHFNSSNYDLQFRTGRVEFKYTSDPNSLGTTVRIVRKENLDETFLDKIQYEIWNEMTNICRETLDKVLGDLSIFETFRGDDEKIKKYRIITETTNKHVNRFLNRFVDRFLAEMKEKYNVKEIPIPDYKSTFSSSGVFSNVGSFQATEGYVGDVMSIVRRADFSLHSNKNHTVTIFGALGFGELYAGYRKYDAIMLFVKSTGKIHMTTGENSVKFSITAPTLSSFANSDLRKLSYTLDIDKLENIDVQMTGLDNGPLDWMSSNVASWMASLFKTRIIKRIEEQMRTYIDAYLKK